MPFFDYNKSGSTSTVGAVSADLVTVPVETRISGAIINATVLGIDRADRTQSVTFTTKVGGGISAGVMSPLSAMSGGTMRSATIAGASVAITLSGGFMNMTVTGVAGKTIDWVGNLELLTM